MRVKNMPLIPVAAVCTFLFFTCTKDKGKALPYTDPCEDVSFANEVKPLIDSNCISCHNAGNPTGIVLNSYSNIRAFIDNNTMYNAVVKNKTMPQGTVLTEAQIKKFRCWIDAGAPDN